MNENDDLYRGLDLPKKTKREREEAAARVEQDERKNNDTTIENFDTKRQKKPLDLTATIVKLKGYMLVDKKFTKASALFCQLISDQLTVQSSELFVKTLATMIDEKGETWSGQKAFQQLFETLDAKRDALLSADHDERREREQMLDTWKFLAITHAQLLTDETYQFNKAAKVVKLRFEHVVNNTEEDQNEEQARRLHTEFMPLLRTLYSKRSVTWATTIVEGVLSLATRHRLLFHELDRVEVDSWTKGMQDRRRAPVITRSAGSEARRNIVTFVSSNTSEAGVKIPGRYNHPLFNKEI
ncbi:unnamed protein product [Peronospora belbahrii]|uniref:MIF4G domain-containing protein n=1 Tax=Peronospora belbahrii TaxID=622444 RepID=A0AAU9L6I2_9STRA|nr:unnamed protein product [Peronospora belbahrii]